MAAAQRPSVWAVLVDHNGVEGSATRLYCPPESPAFEVDALKKAAKTEFGPLLAHVAASQLSVSVNRNGAAERASALVADFPAGRSEDEPLYIHAPAPPQEEEEDNAQGAEGANNGAHGWFSSSSVLFHRITVLVCLVAACCLAGIFQGWIIATMFVIGAVFSQSCRILVPVHRNFFERMCRS